MGTATSLGGHRPAPVRDMRPLGVEPFQEFTLRGLFRVNFHPGSQPNEVRARTIGCRATHSNRHLKRRPADGRRQDDTPRRQLSKTGAYFALDLPSLTSSRRVSHSATSERDRLQHFLDQQRNAVLAIIEGLDETQLNTPVLPSGWTPIGAVPAPGWRRSHVVPMGRPRHPAAGDLGRRHRRPALRPEAPFTTRHSSAAVIEQYRRQCEMSNEILRSRDLHAALLGELGFDWPTSPSPIFAWVVLHMIEETARHAGHLDAARELLDGVIGRGPR